MCAYFVLTCHLISWKYIQKIENFNFNFSRKLLISVISFQISVIDPKIIIFLQ